VRGLGGFQMAQMKQRDARVFALCQHLRSAIDIFEQIAAEPFRLPEKPSPEPASQPVAAPPRELPPEKLAFTLKEASAALGVGRTTLYAAIADGRLTAVKLGNRTLILGETLRAWLASLPAVRHGKCRSPG
jgi:excisionase family DNA binding protein